MSHGQMRAALSILLLLLLTGPVGAEPPAEPPRGPLTLGQVIARYAAALRYFQPALEEKRASELAERVVTASQRAGLDARLVIAVLVADGALADPKADRLAGEKADRLVRELVADLKTGLAGTKPGPPGEEAIRRVLVRRGERQDRKHAPAYVARALRLYRQLRGEEPEGKRGSEIS
jgi:hypothetical protein